MAVEIKNKENKNIIYLRDMKDGQIGRICKCVGKEKTYIGFVVQKHGDKLIAIGEDSETSWYCNNIVTNDEYQIEILKDETELIITNNQ